MSSSQTEAESRDPPPSPDPVDLLSYRELLLEVNTRRETSSTELK